MLLEISRQELVDIRKELIVFHDDDLIGTVFRPFTIGFVFDKVRNLTFDMTRKISDLDFPVRLVNTAIVVVSLYLHQVLESIKVDCDCLTNTKIFRILI